MTYQKDRFVPGFVWGVVATVVMSVFMLVGVATGMSPMPKPVPAAILGKLGAGGLPRPAMMAVAAGAHLAYGGLWAGLLATLVRPVTIGAGLLLGVGLWLVMQSVVLPLLGWGIFGTAITPTIAVATLVLHLVYGAALGGLLRWRGSSPAPAEST